MVDRRDGEVGSPSGPHVFPALRPRGGDGRDRPILLAVLTAALVLISMSLFMWLVRLNPASMIVGAEGVHDPREGHTPAGCLDCHVPFIGTPGSRCLGPGCHGELATGTPPRDGAAMPIRFHVALRDEACTSCHVEHRGRDVRVGFSHDKIPKRIRDECRRCHSGASEPGHARTDSVPCDLCHEKSWAKAPARHDKLSAYGCDVCHTAPNTPAHATVAGTCTDCHTTSSWAPEPSTRRVP